MSSQTSRSPRILSSAWGRMDVEELLPRGATTVVPSRGMQLQRQVDPRTVELLNQRGVTVHIEETTEAARVYNDLAAAGSAVAGLFHSTC